MPHLDSIPPSKCRLYLKWQDAPLGALLQIAHPDAGSAIPTLCIRSQDLADEPSSPCLVIVEGEETGAVFYEEELEHRPALDVREHVHLRIASPRPVHGHAFHVGGAYAHKDELGIVWMFAQYDGTTSHLVCIHAPDDKREWTAVLPFGHWKDFVHLGHIMAVPTMAHMPDEGR